MNSTLFKTYWQKIYSNCPPFGHAIRGLYPDFWFRIHSLPKSKRYAGTEVEYQIILQRHNQLITDLIGIGEEIVLLFNVVDKDDFAFENYNNSFFNSFQRIDFSEILEEPNYFVAIKIEKWEEGKFDAVLRDIADDLTRVLFICPSKYRIIAPYDGGVDIILEDSELVNIFKEKYRDWLPSNDTGM